MMSVIAFVLLERIPKGFWGTALKPNQEKVWERENKVAYSNGMKQVSTLGI